MKSSEWYLYMLRCRDGSLYTGITTNISRRLMAHNGMSPGGAKYLRGRGPAELVFIYEAGTRSLASRLEIKIKRLPKQKKEELVRDNSVIEDLISQC